MHSSEEHLSTRRRVSRKLQKRRKDSQQPTMDLPERLKDHGEDADEDVIHPPQGPQMFMNMNQSIFGLIAAAGSTVNFNDRFEGQSSDEEDVGDDESGQSRLKGKGREDVAQTTILAKGATGEEKAGRHRRRISGNLLRSLPQLPRIATRSLSKRTSRLKGHRKSDLNADAEGEGEGDGDGDGEASLSSQTNEPQSPTIEPTKADREGRRAPIMSRILEARVEMSSRPSFDLERISGDYRRGDVDSGDSGPSPLAQKLKEIFEFEDYEEVVDGKYLCIPPPRVVILCSSLIGL